MSMENREGPENFSFLREVVKEEPPNWKKFTWKIIRLAFAGMIFGISASVGLSVCKPWMDEKIDAARTITIPEDMESEEHPDEQEMTVEKPEEVKIPELTVENYKELQRAVYEIADKANKSVVSVSSYPEGGEAAGESPQEAVSASGVIVPSGSREYLILTTSEAAHQGAEVEITFVDGQKYPAALKQKDEVLGAAVFAVGRDAVAESTRQQIEEAVLGNANAVTQGEMVIALGSPFGSPWGIGYGIVSGKGESVTLADRTYRVLGTDIAASGDGSGILVNMAGEVVGVSWKNGKETENLQMFDAFYISDIKKELELLLNGNSVPYSGISAIEVTKSIADKQEMPEGIYVRDIAADSPAMQAGVQCGDIITAVGNVKVKSLKSYHSELLQYKKGDEMQLSARRLGAEGYIKINYTVIVGGAEG